GREQPVRSRAAAGRRRPRLQRGRARSARSLPLRRAAQALVTADAHRGAVADADGMHRAVRCACAVLVLALAACATPLPAPAPADPAAHPAADARPAPQPRREWRFDEDGVVFDNRGPAARLAGVERLGAGRYRVDIAP